MQQNKPHLRVHLIDEIRGIAIIFMVVYHFFYDLVAIFGVNIPAFYVAQKFVLAFVFIFVFISGSSSAFSRSNMVRGLKCFGLGIGLTLVTYFFMRDQLILFGILHMLGVSMVLYAALCPLIKKIPPIWLISGALFLFILTFSVPEGELAFFIPLPRILYNVGFLFPLGFAAPDFYSSDYFSLMPWFFCFVAGSGFGRLLKEKRLPDFFYKAHFKPLCFVGRNTLIIYVLHQPIVYSILYMIFELI